MFSDGRGSFMRLPGAKSSQDTAARVVDGVRHAAFIIHELTACNIVLFIAWNKMGSG
ncbi:MAG: hypothetical protein ACI3XJ_03485 [Oscillospiraceae bacterium]